MRRNNQQQQPVKVAVLSILLLGVIGLIIWEVIYFSRRNQPPVVADASSTGGGAGAPAPAASGATPANSQDVKTPVTPNTGAPITSLSRRGVMTFIPGSVTDPFKPKPAPPKKVPVIKQTPQRPLPPMGGVPSVPPAIVVTDALPPRTATFPPPQPVIPEEKILRVTGVVMDESAPVAIVENKEKQYLLHTGEYLPNRARVIAISAQGIVVRQGQKQQQVNVGETLPWQETAVPTLQRISASGSSRQENAGPLAPDFTLFAPDGKTKVSLSSFRGKTVLLNFFASW